MTTTISMVDFTSVVFKMGYLYGRLCLIANDNDCDFNTFIDEINNKFDEVVIDVKTLKDLFNVFCLDVEIITYKNKKVVVVGRDNLFGVVYLNEKNKVVHMEYEDKEIELILTREEEKEEREMRCDDCEKAFYAGKEFCKSCGFDLNSFNKEKEE
jgi:hypothetical protein